MPSSQNCRAPIVTLPPHARSMRARVKFGGLAVSTTPRSTQHAAGGSVAATPQSEGTGSRPGTSLSALRAASMVHDRIHCAADSAIGGSPAARRALLVDSPASASTPRIHRSKLMSTADRFVMEFAPLWSDAQSCPASRAVEAIEATLLGGALSEDDELNVRVPAPSLWLTLSPHDARLPARQHARGVAKGLRCR